MRIDITPATRQVLVRTAPNASGEPSGGCVTPVRMIGLTKMMYDITTNVVAPAIVLMVFVSSPGRVTDRDEKLRSRFERIKTPVGESSLFAMFSFVRAGEAREMARAGLD